MQEKFFSTKELANIFGVSHSAIKRFILKQTIKPISNNLFSIKQFTEYGFIIKQNVCNDDESRNYKNNQSNKQNIQQQTKNLQSNANLNNIQQQINNSTVNKNLNNIQQNGDIKNQFVPYSNEFIERIKDYTSQIADALLDHSTDGNFICPACGNGGRDSGTGIKFDGKVAHCFACNASFNIFKAVQSKLNINFLEAVKICAETAGLTPEFDNVAADSVRTSRQKPKREGFMTRRDVAAYLGVGETTVRRWCATGIFTEDIKDHNGVSWYSIERVEQLKSVYRQDWQDTKQIEKPQQDLSDYFVHCHKNINDSKVQAYLKERGIDDSALIERFNLGYDPDCNCLVIPHNQYFCTRRYLKTWTDEKGREHRYKYITGSKTALFNADLTGDFIFVTEGAINALSIIKAGSNALALGGAGNGNLLIDALKSAENKPILIILLDEDKPGQDKADELLKSLFNLKICAVKAHLPIFPDTDKDINDLLRADEEAFKNFIADTIKSVEILKDKLKDWPFDTTKPDHFDIRYDSDDRRIFLPKFSLELTLPENYSMSKDGILEYDWNAKKKAFDINLVSYSPIIISKLIDNIDNNLAKCELSCYDDVKKKWRRIVDDNSVIFNSSTIISLAKRHLDVTSDTSKRLVKYLAKFRAVNKDKIPTSETINNIGWRNNEFLPISNKSKYELDDTVKADFIEKFQSSGDKKVVIPLIKEVKKFDIANIVIGITLAAPLRRIAFDHNIAAHLGGITGSGKTAIGTLAYSLFYSTKVEIPRFNGTRSGFEKIFAGLLDLPIFIDDANNLADNERKQAEKMIYDFVNGVGRIRTNKNLDTLRPSTFYGSLLTSGEHFLTTSNSAGGAKTREMEFNIGKSFIPKETAVKIYKITKKNYGLFLKEWIETIQEREEEIKEVYEIIRYGGTLQKIKIEGFHNTYEGKIPRHIDNIAAITTANIYFTMRFLNEDDDDPTELVKKELECAKRVFAMLPDYSQILDYKRAIPIIRDWIISRPKFFIQAGKYENANGEGEFELTAEGSSTYGVIRKNYVAINPTEFENFMLEQGFSSLTINQLADDNFIIRNGRNLTTPILNYPSKGKVSRMYKIALKNIFEEIKE